MWEQKPLKPFEFETEESGKKGRVKINKESKELLDKADSATVKAIELAIYRDLRYRP